MNQPWNLARSNYRAIRELKYEVAVLPFGATEPHNLHLPYSTDTLEATIIGEKVCEAAWKQGAKVVLLPTIPFGTQTNMQEFPLALNVNPTTMTALVSDLLESVVNSGIRKILFLNSHGGNALKPIVRELGAQTEGHLFLCDWFNSVNDVYHDIFEKPEDHAGEMETSFGLAYFPELVAIDENGKPAGDQGKKRETRFEALNQGWVSVSRPWHLLTTNSGAADPHAATAAKGRQLMEVLVTRLSAFISELSESTLDSDFPFS
ncbi:MAG: creatininase family protein [Pirellulaceae bacterium]|nr:creatininase family protein [Pirellulaceae bacterium]